MLYRERAEAAESRLKAMEEERDEMKRQRDLLLTSDRHKAMEEVVEAGRKFIDAVKATENLVNGCLREYTTLHGFPLRPLLDWMYKMRVLNGKSGSLLNYRTSAEGSAAPEESSRV